MLTSVSQKVHDMYNTYFKSYHYALIQNILDQLIYHYQILCTFAL